MAIELEKAVRDELIRSIQRYFEENLDDTIGNIAAGGLLGFVLEEIGPVIYNKAVADVQEHMQIRVADLEFEIHEEEAQYWKKYDQPRRR
ncbi:DUF2164 family protein [Duganella sp. FT80W]|uniref:DUF2164 family protein n=1 Tax=Duganella guangzhouensis TaxID=2666084 RepID=A0A6I2L6H4_9BURK|nr:DUF2164 domain-containing protein [Duganella guangzhouensis]MRW93875.1 DUF2164 family protein [Duganella guangzhouensis]